MKGKERVMAEVKRYGYCVDGEWKTSSSGKYMEVTDSSTGEVIAEVPQCTQADCFRTGGFSCVVGAVRFQTGAISL